MKKIRIITGEAEAGGEAIGTRGFSDFVGRMSAASFEVDADVLSRELKDVYSTMVDSLCELRDVNPDIEIQTVQFTLGIDTMGQVSLFSSVSGSNVTKPGITFNLSFKK